VEPSFIINLWAGSSPLPLERLPRLDLQHLEVFTSRAREEGRERFRLHVGYFDNPRAAEGILQRVRDEYPTAWVVPAERHLPLARFKGVVATRMSSDVGMIQPLQTLPPAAVGEHGSLPRPGAAVESDGTPCLRLQSAVDTVTQCNLAADASEMLGEREGLRPMPALVLPVPSELAKILPAILQSASPVERPGGSFSKLSIMEWYAEALTQAEPKPRSWFQRFTRRFTRWLV
jgi:hypothetical protein